MSPPRLFTNLLLAIVGSTVVVAAQTDETTGSDLSMTTILEAIPECALTCVVTSVEAAQCSLTDVKLLTDCTCTNVTLQSDMSICVQKSCEITEQAVASSFMHELCASYPKESRVREMKTTGIVTAAIALPIVVARCAARYIYTSRLWWDDWMSILATIFLLAVAGLQIVEGEMGFGLHYWNIDVTNRAPLLQTFWVGQIFYIVVQVLAKIAILALYARIFNPTRWFRRTVNGFIVFMIGHGLVFVLIIVFQCQPVAAVWDSTLEGKCLDVNPVGFAGAIMAIIEDIVLILLPIPAIRKLQVAGRKRVGVAIIFAIASFAAVTSMIRLKYLAEFGRSYDSTWDEVDIVIWSVIELLSAVVCGSLSPLRPWLSPLLPRVNVSWGKTSINTNSPSSSNPLGPRTGKSSTLCDTNQDEQHKDGPLYGLSPLATRSGSAGRQWEELPYDLTTVPTSDQVTTFPQLQGQLDDKDHSISSFNPSNENDSDSVIQGNQVVVTLDVQVSRSQRSSSFDGHGMGSSTTACSIRTPLPQSTQPRQLKGEENAGTAF